VLPVIDLPKPSKFLVIYLDKNLLLLKPNIPSDLSELREMKKSVAMLLLGEARLMNYYQKD